MQNPAVIEAVQKLAGSFNLEVQIK